MSDITYFGKVSEAMINRVNSNGQFNENCGSEQRPHDLTPDNFKKYLRDNDIRPALKDEDSLLG